MTGPIQLLRNNSKKLRRKLSKHDNNNNNNNNNTYNSYEKDNVSKKSIKSSSSPSFSSIDNSDNYQSDYDNTVPILPRLNHNNITNRHSISNSNSFHQNSERALNYLYEDEVDDHHLHHNNDFYNQNTNHNTQKSSFYLTNEFRSVQNLSSYTNYDNIDNNIYDHDNFSKPLFQPLNNNNNNNNNHSSTHRHFTHFINSIKPLKRNNNENLKKSNRKSVDIASIQRNSQLKSKRILSDSSIISTNNSKTKIRPNSLILNENLIPSYPIHSNMSRSNSSPVLHLTSNNFKNFTNSKSVTSLNNMMDPTILTLNRSNLKSSTITPININSLNMITSSPASSRHIKFSIDTDKPNNKIKTDQEIKLEIQRENDSKVKSDMVFAVFFHIISLMVGIFVYIPLTISVKLGIFPLFLIITMFVVWYTGIASISFSLSNNSLVGI